MLGELQKEVQPNKITVTEHIAVVAAVGRKMAYRPGVSGKIFAKLGENGVNIRMITQGRGAEHHCRRGGKGLRASHSRTV